METTKPYVEIIEQPTNNGSRFRYKCERKLNSVFGANSTPEKKIFPSIKIIGYKGPFKVIVSCVTKDEPYRPHPYNLVGAKRCKNGVYIAEVSSKDMTVTIAHVCIQCVRRKDIQEALKIREELRVDPFQTGFEHKEDVANIDLNTLRLCFQVFLEGEKKGTFDVPLEPVVSNSIFDKRTVLSPSIYELSHSGASVAGGMKMILLCEKVVRNDIQIRFFEKKDEQVVWEGFGNFEPNNIYKQTAIVFRTPAYSTQEVTQPVQVYVQLKRPSDGATSESLPFQLFPSNANIAVMTSPQSSKQIWRPQLSTK